MQVVTVLELLSITPTTCSCLLICSWIPVAIKKNQSIRTDEVDPTTPSLPDSVSGSVGRVIHIYLAREEKTESIWV